jgi:hypothetical protein
MPKLRPAAAIAAKIPQSIRILEAYIRKINIQNHRADKLQFIQRFLSFLAAAGLIVVFSAAIEFRPTNHRLRLNLKRQQPN